MSTEPVGISYQSKKQGLIDQLMRHPLNDRTSGFYEACTYRHLTNLHLQLNDNLRIVLVGSIRELCSILKINPPKEMDKMALTTIIEVFNVLENVRSKLERTGGYEYKL